MEKKPNILSYFRRINFKILVPLVMILSLGSCKNPTDTKAETDTERTISTETTENIDSLIGNYSKNIAQILSDTTNDVAKSDTTNIAKSYNIKILVLQFEQDFINNITSFENRQIADFYINTVGGSFAELQDRTNEEQYTKKWLTYLTKSDSLFWKWNDYLGRNMINQWNYIKSIDHRMKMIKSLEWNNDNDIKSEYKQKYFANLMETLKIIWYPGSNKDKYDNRLEIESYDKIIKMMENYRNQLKKDLDRSSGDIRELNSMVSNAMNHYNTVSHIHILQNNLKEAQKNTDISYLYFEDYLNRRFGQRNISDNISSMISKVWDIGQKLQNDSLDDITKAQIEKDLIFAINMSSRIKIASELTQKQELTKSEITYSWINEIDKISELTNLVRSVYFYKKKYTDFETIEIVTILLSLNNADLEKINNSLNINQEWQNISIWDIISKWSEEIWQWNYMQLGFLINTIASNLSISINQQGIRDGLGVFYNQDMSNSHDISNAIKLTNILYNVVSSVDIDSIWNIPKDEFEANIDQILWLSWNNENINITQIIKDNLKSIISDCIEVIDSQNQINITKLTQNINDMMEAINIKNQDLENNSTYLKFWIITTAMITIMVILIRMTTRKQNQKLEEQKAELEKANQKLEKLNEELEKANKKLQIYETQMKESANPSFILQKNSEWWWLIYDSNNIAKTNAWCGQSDNCENCENNECKIKNRSSIIWPSTATINKDFLVFYDKNWNKINKEDFSFKDCENNLQTLLDYINDSDGSFTAEYIYHSEINWKINIFKTKIVKISEDYISMENTNITDILKKNKKLEEQKAELEEQKAELKEQKAELEEVNQKLAEINNEMIGSINYAMTIQQSLLPSDETLKEMLWEFVKLYLPRNIVSGDFYRARKIEDYTYFAVADCTGHWVPWAFLSMLGMSHLDQIITSGDQPPYYILTQLKKNMISALNKKNSNDNGMDISVIRIKTNEIEYAGAKNSIYIIRNKESWSIEINQEKYDFNFEEWKNEKIYTIGKKIILIMTKYWNKVLIEIKADNIVIWNNYRRENEKFTNNTIKTEPWDMVYMFSDGYVDQFGWPKNKKLLTNKFKQLLWNIAHLDISKQNEILAKAIKIWKSGKDYVFEYWKDRNVIWIQQWEGEGDLNTTDQTDDISVFWFRII